jgi:hypothetical protein
MKEMKRFFLMLAALGTLAAEPLSQRDRDYAMSALHASRKALIDAAGRLSEAQAKFKAGPDRWSIFEITEHLAMTESFLKGYALSTLKTPAAPEKRELVKGKDEAMLKGVTNREQKVQAPAPLAPKATFASVAAALDAFQAERMKTIQYVESTSDALRDHFVDKFGPTGAPADAYQILLLLAGHTDRHVAQILEVKAAPGYPKK